MLSAGRRGAFVQQELDRHLAAILALDIAGYSRLMNADEQGTHRRMLARRKTVIDPQVEAHRGRVVKGTGDGVLAEFTSARNAIGAAIAIQSALAEANGEEPDVPPMTARIGITIGDIIIGEDGDIFGDGVNIAARLEGKAPAGGICVSGRALDDLRQVGVPFGDFGEIALKNIGPPVRVYCIHPDAAARGRPPKDPTKMLGNAIGRRALVFGGAGVTVAAGAGLLAWHPWAATASKGSIAVLPFANLSGDTNQAYFSDGLSEELRAALARNVALKVAAPTSSNMFKSDDGDARSIAGKLGVAYLLEGSVRREDKAVRIVAELVDASTGFTSWSQTFDRTIDDIFAVQSSIAETVADALAVHVTRTSSPGGTQDVAAYDAYLRGKALFDADIDEASDRSALDQFDLATQQDSNFAAAFAARSRVLSAIASEYAAPAGTAQLYKDAIAAAERAVSLAPDLAEAQMALGLAIYTGRLDVKAARPAYDKAAQIGAGDADIQLLYAVYCSRSDRSADAIAAIQRATDLDRLNPRVFRAAGLVRYTARDYAAAIPLAKQALALNPTLRVAHANIGNALLMQGKLAEAKAAYQAEPLDLSRLPGLAIVARKLGDTAGAKAAMDQLVRDLGDSALYQQAQVLAQWGDRDGAIAMLGRAKQAGDSGLLIAPTDPLLDPVRNDPRFSPLLGGLHLT
nr:adenylate/guanylate cyclase domain-containing protein [Sphingomonas chungangi]